MPSQHLKIAALLVLILSTSSACGSDDVVVDACERFDECNALNDGLSVNECIETVDRNLSLVTPTQAHDWEGLMRACLDFAGCQPFLNCVSDNGL